MHTSEAPQLLNAMDLCRLLGLGRTKVFSLLASGEIPSITIGKARRVRAEALRQWLEEQEQAQARPEVARWAETATRQPAASRVS